MQGQATYEHSEGDVEERLLKVMKHKNEVIAQNYALQQILIRKDSTIERLRNNESYINAQLQSAVSKKTDAVNRLKEIDETEIWLRRKEKEFEIERDRLNAKIESLTDNLKRSSDETKVLQQERLSTSELKTLLQGQLQQAKSTIRRLTENDQSLKNQLDEKELALHEQAKVIEDFKKELEDQSKVAKSYKADAVDKQATINLLIGDRTILTERLTEINAKYNDTLEKLILKEREHNILKDKFAVNLEEFCRLQLNFSEMEASHEKLAQEMSVCMTENDVANRKLESAELEIKDLAALCEIVFDKMNDFREKKQMVDDAERNYKQLYDHINHTIQKKRNRSFDHYELSESYSRNKKPRLDVQQDGQKAIGTKIICIPGNSDGETENCIISVEALRKIQSSSAALQDQRPYSNILSAPIGFIYVDHDNNSKRIEDGRDIHYRCNLDGGNH